MESYAGMVEETLEDLASEERYRIYKLLRLGIRFRLDWPLEITGIFEEVGEDAEVGSSKCKPSPGSFPSDKPPSLKFSGLLMENGAERLKLARA
jgi:hypothetical protein